MQDQIYAHLAYFDIFNHPLKKDELKNYNLSKADEFENALAFLLENKLCFKQAEYFSIQENISPIIAQRIAKEKEAKHYFDKLPFYAKLIQSFPFVSAFGISGSLSKNVMHENGDIDYFIITKPGRLWICRTMLVVFKKIFLLNSKKYFCVNYFVDEKNLKILDENIFTAIEITHLLPVYNPELIQQFKQENYWTKTYIANFRHPVKVKELQYKRKLSHIFEWLLKGKTGDKLDLYLMRFTYKKWTKKFKHFDAKKFELTMRTNRGISKHHPRDFQQSVLKEFTKRMEQINSEI
ncbi:hypothetical protein [Crocinitomix catalasitica]|uniref:hypothetical protein n=1 Tax=Crocinitomix catalasitica TaxID=184607 RepID=UPI000481C08D|nr:hypothetical protein [Crocinitomix catalasitica]